MGGRRWRREGRRREGEKKAVNKKTRKASIWGAWCMRRPCGHQTKTRGQAADGGKRGRWRVNMIDTPLDHCTQRKRNNNTAHPITTKIDPEKKGNEMNVEVCCAPWVHGLTRWVQMDVIHVRTRPVVLPWIDDPWLTSSLPTNTPNLLLFLFRVPMCPPTTKGVAPSHISFFISSVS